MTIIFGTPEAAVFRAPHLEPCPFCGAMQLSERVGVGPLPYHVECGDCGAVGPKHCTAEWAREEWNRRAAVQP